MCVARLCPVYPCSVSFCHMTQSTAISKPKNGNAGFQGLIFKAQQKCNFKKLPQNHSTPARAQNTISNSFIFCHSGHEKPIIMSNNGWLSLIRFHPAASMFFYALRLILFVHMLNSTLEPARVYSHCIVSACLMTPFIPSTYSMICPRAERGG